ncbi:MAG: hypothetical protein EXR51_00480 [Dehalococcoidia bacterium]|nr:hypothetical protein [Dehalococcoidia bacterium]
MPVRIGTLVSYVSVERGNAAPTLELISPAALAVPAPESLAHVAPPEPSEPVSGGTSGQSPSPRPASDEAAVLRALTDRVYRLMRDELTIALERE